MIGDTSDILKRLKAVLPSRWFADETPILDAMLTGVTWSWSWLYSMVQYVIGQTRLNTATDIWIDILAQDFFASRLGRRNGEGDPAFRRRILQELIRERGTRNAIISNLTDLTGHAPQIFEPARITDTGAYGNSTGAGAGLAWGLAGGWGNLNLPFQCFITAYRPSNGGIPAVTGWGSASPTSAIGGYSRGAIEYASLEMIQRHITDADIYQAVADVLPVASIGWTQITN